MVVVPSCKDLQLPLFASQPLPLRARIDPRRPFSSTRSNHDATSTIERHTEHRRGGILSTYPFGVSLRAVEESGGFVHLVLAF